MRVAVTGVGGGVGQSIMKALSLASQPIDIYPIDIQPLSAGLFRGVKGTVLPRIEDPSGLEKWETWLTAQSIDALIPGSDHDLLPLAAIREEWLARNICKALVSDLSLVQTCRDKAQTYQVLENAGIPVPKSAWDLSESDAIMWAKDNGYPVILKPRDGFASRHLHLVQDEDELCFFLHRTPNPILQEYLQHDGQVDEFTCAVFVDNNGRPTGTFMARRDLSSGATYRAEVNFWPEIHDLLVTIGTTLRPRGPLNVQLRLTERGPVPFELNIRCSGTTAIRAYFGYNEPEMLLRHYVLGEPLTRPQPRIGYAFRYWNEIFLEGVNQEQLREGPYNLTGSILAWP